MFNLKNIPFIYRTGLRIKHLYLSSLSKKISDKYLANNIGMKGLQIGAGHNMLKGWFNTDYFPRQNIAFLDVTKKFEIADESFEFVFSEHHIEHIHYKEANFMLKEIFRILKKGGVVRICTPDLSKYLNAYNSKDLKNNPFINDIMDNWIKRGFHNAKNFIPEKGNENIAFFINDIFYNYEHKFIYDETTLIELLRSVGFINVYTCSPSISDYQELNGIESHTGITMPFTLAIEAIK